MFAPIVAPALARIGVHYGWVMVALTFFTAICTSAAVSLLGVVLLPMIEEFDWNRADVSGAMGLMLIMYAGMAPFAGALLIRFGLRNVVAASAALASLGLLGATLIDQRWQLWVCFGLLVGTAAGMTALALGATVANRWFKERRGLAMGILTAAFAAGQLSFLPMAAWLAENFDWRVAVTPAFIGLGACATLYFLFGRDWPSDVGLPPFGGKEIEPPPAKPAGNVVSVSFSVLGQAVQTPVFWVLGGTFFICGLSTTGLINQHFIPFCADYGVAAVAAASFMAMIGVFNFFGTIISGWLSDRFDNRMLLCWYYTLRGISLIWLPFSDLDAVALTIFAVFFGLDYVATVPPTVKLTGQYFGPVKAPIVFGWAFASHQAGGALSAYLSGAARDAWSSYTAIYLVVGLVCFSAAAFALTIRDPRGDPEPSLA